MYLSQVLARAMPVSDKVPEWNRVGGSGSREAARTGTRASEQASGERKRERSLNQASQPANNRKPHFAHVLLLSFLLLATRSTSRPLFKQLAGSYSYTHARTPSLTHTNSPRVCGDEHQDPSSYIISHAVSVCGDLIHNGESAPPRQRTISLGKAVLPLLLERHRHRHRHW